MRDEKKTVSPCGGSGSPWIAGRMRKSKRYGQSLPSSVVDSYRIVSGRRKTGAQAQRAEADEAVTAGTRNLPGSSYWTMCSIRISREVSTAIVYVPEDDGTDTPYALFVTLPGYEGLYFQGVGGNRRSEDFPPLRRQDPKDVAIIVAAPQLEDWGETSLPGRLLP